MDLFLLISGNSLCHVVLEVIVVERVVVFMEALRPEEFGIRKVIPFGVRHDHATFSSLETGSHTGGSDSEKQFIPC